MVHIAANLTPANGVFIMSSTTALALSPMRNPLGQPEFPDVSRNGGTFQGLPVITSQCVAGLGGSPVGNLLILVNASDIYLSDDGQVVIDASREASLEMADNPTNARCAGGVRRGAPPHANEVFAEVFALDTPSAGRRNRRVMGRSSALSFYSCRQGSDAAVTMPLAHETTAAAIATAFS